MKWKVGLWIVAVVFAFQCSHYDEVQRNGLESSAGGSSHNFGQNCMECHNQPGNEAAEPNSWWNIAGSIYDDSESAPFTNATIELWSQPNREGVLYYTLDVDASGNFYSAKIIKYNGTCFPVVVNNETGDYEAMEPAFRGGGCSSCHGKTEDVITVD